MRVATWAQDSPVGPLVISTGAAGLVEIDVAGPRLGTRRTEGRAEPAVARALDAYFAGDLDALTGLPVDLGDRTPFSLAVLQVLRRVPAGAVTSYGQLADAAGRPGAGRAVGGAVGANPVPLVVPCHRVVAGDGGLGGFSCGLHVKRWLLTHEGHTVAPEGGPPVRMKPAPVPV